MDLDTELPKAYAFAKAGDFESATRILFAAVREHGALIDKHPMYIKTALHRPYADWVLSAAAEPLLKTLQAERKAALLQETK